VKPLRVESAAEEELDPPKHRDRIETLIELLASKNENPAKALSDGANALRLDLLPEFWRSLQAIDAAGRRVRNRGIAATVLKD
jgi:3-deoxy-D-manno-octulosonic acid (KDO) 8-phosphate synthase